MVLPANVENAVKKEETYTTYPVRLTIPSIDVSAKITSVGINVDGNMSTPNNYDDVGWYKYGPMPGEKGSAVLTGHSGNGLGLPDVVFGHLDNVKIGDDIYVGTKGTSQLHFKVTSIEEYDYNAPTNLIFNQDNGNFLKLITCSGSFIRQYNTHDKRIVVTATLDVS